MIRQSGNPYLFWYSGGFWNLLFQYSGNPATRKFDFRKMFGSPKKSKGNESRKFLKILAKLWYGDNFLTRYLRGRRGIVGLEFLYIPVWTYLAFRFLLTSYLSNILIFITVASFLTGFLLSLVFASFLIAFAFLFPFLLLLLSHLLFIFLYNCFVVCYV